MSDFNESQSAYWQKNVHRARRDPRHPIIKAYVEPKLRYISQFVPINRETTILDVGAGNGYFSYYFDKLSQCTAIDYSPVMIGYNPVSRRSVMDARDLKFPDQSFNLVFCHALLHHVDPTERPVVIREMRRVSKHYLVAIEPNRSNPLVAAFGFMKKEERGTLDFSQSYLNSLFVSAGATPLAISSFGLLTPNNMPIPTAVLPLEVKLFEKPLWNGISNILVARR